MVKLCLTIQSFVAAAILYKDAIFPSRLKQTTSSSCGTWIHTVFCGAMLYIIILLIFILNFYFSSVPVVWWQLVMWPGIIDLFIYLFSFAQCSFTYFFYILLNFIWILRNTRFFLFLNKLFINCQLSLDAHTFGMF